MANSLSPELLAQLFSQESNDPFLTLVTLSHSSFAATVRLVNNSENIISRSNTFQAFPMKIVLPIDDGESAREVQIEFDNVAREIIKELREVTTPIDVKLELVLASIPDSVQMEIDDLKIGNISYDAYKVSAKLYMDDFLFSGLTSESYTPTNFPGIF
jgi:Domain of unknown function (DUF1833)